MRLKHLEAALSSLTREFPDPKVELEQYPTSSHLAASVIQLAVDHGDLGEGRICLDLGCGTGMLAVGAAFVCDQVLAVDCDPDALEVAQMNVESIELEDTMQWIQARVCTKKAATSGGGSRGNNKSNTKGRGRGGRGRGRGRGGRAAASQSGSDTMAILVLDGNDGIPLTDNCVDTVLTNPPFGTKQNAGIDVQFLRTACRLARRSVYSFHKRSTRTFLLKTLEEWGYHATVAAEMAFDIPQAYRFHTQKTKDVEVDLIRVEVGGTSSPLEEEGEPL
eukprot:Nitzschia sp. Nitz4//scaffold123_size70294//374//1204//NITZ4_005915-RA/size70294-processed-gene-0.0-mRNA-1//1//CDS//3329534446//5533//frame0